MYSLVSKLLLIITLSFTAGASIANNDNPEQIVRSTSKDVLDIIKKNDKDTSKMRDLVDQRLSPLADYNRMTSLAVGRYWKSATPAQQDALSKEFRTMMIRTYLSALTLYKNAQINVRGTRAGNDASEQTVRTEVTLPGQKPIPLDFSFEKIGSEWKVFDISVEGISFINNHRNQFGAVIRKDGIDGLIKSLSEKNNSSRQSK
ncbi:MlaC/ttg2D family ABC transporter substrate-binding protein [Deefgea piscis]|uniref:MlaC/ttg2D family ABC transporter substrate-binding protein n=1 Tax=Deefgea piscis TaxID=2739061 RepID=UPI001C82064F|nr:ABC transporter substrate-binding protein [Deefgea piscis]QZA81163.1 ABC transporter substrate-binding protein [Deefgea piscis]